MKMIKLNNATTKFCRFPVVGVVSHGLFGLCTRLYIEGPMLKNRAYFSSTSSSLHPNRGLITDGVHSLPSIDVKDDFYREFKIILSDLDQSFTYKLEYCLWLNTNDKGKELMPILGNYNSVFDNNPTNEEISNLILGKRLLEKMYEYHGYYIVHSNLFDAGLVLDLDVEVKRIYTILGEYVIHTNETSEEDEFVEFKKETFLRISRYKGDTPNNATNKGVVGKGLPSAGRRYFSSYYCLRNEGETDSNVGLIPNNIITESTDAKLFTPLRIAN